MKVLSNFKLTSKYKSVKKELLSYDHYASLTKDDKLVHIGDILPEMTNIAIWDNTEEKTFLINAREYDLDVYPEDRYLVIGVEAIPKEHVDGVHTKIVSLNHMSCTTPKIGGSENIRFGLYNRPIDGMDKKSYVPIINENGTTEFGDVQEIKKFSDLNDLQTNHVISVDFHESDFQTYVPFVPNPFTNNPKQYYVLYNTDSETKPFKLLPSPYNEINEKNTIFFTENLDEEHPSCLLNMDGKGETTKILNQIEKNGNTTWKTGTTIPNVTSSTLGWDKIAPAAQCCWMYCVKEGYETNPIFGQGCWYLPTLGEGAYVFARQGTIINTLLYMMEKNTRLNIAAILDFTCSCVNNDERHGYVNDSYGFIGFGYRLNNLSATNALCMI